MFALSLSFCVILFFTIAAITGNARAADIASLEKLFAGLHLPEKHIDFSNGFEASGHAWSAYASAVIGLSGPLDRDGWRVRLSGLYNHDIYKGQIAYCRLSDEEMKQLTGTNFSDLCNDIAGDPPTGAELEHLSTILAPAGLEIRGDQIAATLTHQKTRYQIGAAPGYQQTFGRLIVKAYLGIAFEQYTITPADDINPLNGSYWGGLGNMEAWLQLNDNVWIASDASYFSGTSSYSAAMKLGYQPLSWLTLGPEAATYGDDGHSSTKAGGFLRLHTLGMETTFSAGITSNYDSTTQTYGSAGIYMRF